MYRRPLAYRMVTAGFDVCLVSSVTRARYREARDESWDKKRSERCARDSGGDSAGHDDALGHSADRRMARRAGSCEALLAGARARAGNTVC